FFLKLYATSGKSFALKSIFLKSICKFSELAHSIAKSKPFSDRSTPVTYKTFFCQINAISSIPTANI
ncbi:MAG: hypothetical protein ACE5J3_07880, partial [Methanosarcinales archaeon]